MATRARSLRILVNSVAQTVVLVVAEPELRACESFRHEDIKVIATKNTMATKSAIIEDPRELRGSNRRALRG
jgi:hypothetical protein